MVSEVGFGLFRRCHYGVKHRRIRACHPREQHHVRAPDKRDDAEGQGSASTWRRQCSLNSVPLSCSRADQFQLQINGRPGFHTRSLAKLPRYSGLTPLEPYLAQVDLAALHDGWSREETATHLAFALEGPALQVLIDLSPEERRDLQALTAALNCCFGQKTSTEQSREELTNRHQREEESVGAFDADIQGLRPKGLPYIPGHSEGRAEPPCFPAGPYTWATPPACPPVVTPRSEWGAERGWASWRGATGWAGDRSITAPAPADESSRTRGGWGPAWGGGGGQPGPTSDDPPTEVQTRPLLLLRRTGALCQGLPCSKPPAPDIVTALKRLWSEGTLTPFFVTPPQQLPNCGALRACQRTVPGRYGCRQALQCSGGNGVHHLLLRKELLSGTAGPLLEDWTPTNNELLTITGERTVMPRKKLLSVVVGMCQTCHEFFLADIRDECIVGLDLLAHWGARADMSGAALCLGNKIVPLRSGQSRHGEAAASQPPPRHQCSPAPAPSRRTRAAETQEEPWGSIVAQTSTSQPLPHLPPRHLRLLLLLRSWGGEVVSIWARRSRSSCNTYWETLWNFLQPERRTVPGQLWCSITLT